MPRPDPRPLPILPGAQIGSSVFDDHESGIDDGEYDARALWRLLGAATVAVLALATASVVLV